jgi:hypothetical protein
VIDGSVTLSLSPARLADLGLSIESPRGVSPSPDRRQLAFSVAPELELGFRTEDGLLHGIGDERLSIPFRGGFVLGARHPRSGTPLPPAVLFDFSLEIGSLPHPDFARIRAAGAEPNAPLTIRNAAFRFDPAGELGVRFGDVVISRDWAALLGRPELVNRRIGSFELRLEAVSTTGVPTKSLGEAPERGPREPDEVVDVLLGELYDLDAHARVGSYPNGVNGLSAATTSCNNGNVRVPWQPPMSPAHPFIGLAMFRESGDALEMIGQSWLKHAFLAVWSNQCDLGCPGFGSDFFLEVGCSDTYSASNNAGQFYLGPRREVNPHTGAWEPCASFFDGTPTDCVRSYTGSEPDAVRHTLEVHDADLGAPDARYFYEACYYVAGDDSLHNNVGWRECTTEWTGSSWRITTTGPWFETKPEPGPVILRWGDQHDTKAVAPDDGLAILATRVTDLGGGQWHYEYALYNRTSDRGLRSFSVPVGSANVTNAAFRDIDHDAATDWTPTIADGVITGATDEWVSDPDAPALFFQTLFNFRFDADAPPTAGAATAGLFAPGIGTSVVFDSQAPATRGGTETHPLVDVQLSSVEPNPFSRATTLRFVLPRRGPVRLSVLDVAGRTVQVLVDGAAPAGPTNLRWNGRDTAGSRVANGVYFFRLESEQGTRVTRGTLLR